MPSSADKIYADVVEDVEPRIATSTESRESWDGHSEARNPSEGARKRRKEQPFVAVAGLKP